MKRRGFLGFLGGAAVAGPSMAKEAVLGLESLQIGGGSMGLVNQAISGGYGYATDAIPMGGDESPTSPHDPSHWAQRELQNFLGRTAEELAEQKRSIRVQALDPDIGALRSFSLDAKVRMQRDRIFEAEQQQTKSYLQRQLNDCIKHFLGRN